MNWSLHEYLRCCAAQLHVTLSDNQIVLFGTFAEELKKWNRKINLTAIRDDHDVVVKHFADSLALLKILTGSGTLLDIGSGGGFPAIPLKIVLPQLSVVSVDAVEKKILFQRQLSRLLNFRDFSAVHARAEELTKSYAHRFDWIVSRAFSDLPHFAGLALPLLKDSGRIVAMKGKYGEDEAIAARAPLGELGVKIVDHIHYRLPVTGDQRYLVVMALAASPEAE